MARSSETIDFVAKAADCLYAIRVYDRLGEPAARLKLDTRMKVKKIKYKGVLIGYNLLAFADGGWRLLETYNTRKGAEKAMAYIKAVMDKRHDNVDLRGVKKW